MSQKLQADEETALHRHPAAQVRPWRSGRHAGRPKWEVCRCGALRPSPLRIHESDRVKAQLLLLLENSRRGAVRAALRAIT